MTSAVVSTDLEALRADIERGVAALVKPSPVRIVRADGTVDEAWQASLLDQLDTAVMSNSGGTVPGRRSTPIPISAEALDLQMEIAAWFGVRASALSTHLQQLPDQAKYTRDHTVLDDIARALTWAAREIQTLLDPPRKLHAAAPCPACGARVVYRPDGCGEVVRQPALRLDPDSCTCTCLGCRAFWPTERLELLALTLGCEPLPSA